MNKERRRKLAELAVRLDEVQHELQEIIEEEEACCDNMPESLQCGDRYEESQEAISALSDIDEWLGEAIESLCEIAEVSV